MRLLIRDRYFCPVRHGFFQIQMPVSLDAPEEAIEDVMKHKIEEQVCPVTGAKFNYEDRVRLKEFID